MTKKEEYQKKYPVKVWLEMPEVWRTETVYEIVGEHESVEGELDGT